MIMSLLPGWDLGTIRSRAIEAMEPIIQFIPLYKASFDRPTRKQVKDKTQLYLMQHPVS